MKYKRKNQRKLTQSGKEELKAFVSTENSAHVHRNECGVQALLNFVYTLTTQD